MEAEIIGAAGIIVSIYALYRSIIERTKLDRQKFAVDMIKEWNNNTSECTSVIRNYYPQKYDNCDAIDEIEVDKILNPKMENPDEKAEYLEIKKAIYKLLNYFEYVSAAYNKRTVDQEIIRNSFSITMLRYYIVLRNLMIIEFLNSKRNHWKPFTRHLVSLINQKDVLLCSGCDKNNCFLKSKEKDAKVRLLNLLNSDDIDKKLLLELKDEINA